MKYIIGLDIGTSNTKAIALDLKGKVLSEHKVGYSIINPAPGYFEQDPERLFDATLTCITQVVNVVNKRYADALLLGISFSSAMHGLIVMDINGKALTNCIIWADTRSESFANSIKHTPIGHDIYRHTGTPIHPMSPLCKLGWMKAHMPSIFHSAAKYISIKEYVFFKLFGRYIIDESIASATGLLDIYVQNWYKPALELAGISADQLSEVVPITYRISGINKFYASILQISPDTPFIIGGSDGCLANLGVNAIQTGDTALTIGTSGAIRVMANKPKTDEKERTFSYILTESMYVLGGAVNNGGVVLRWFKDQLMQLDKRLSEEKQYDGIIDLAASVPAGAAGLIFLPYLLGERAPHWNADAKGLFFGLQMHHNRAHFARALIEGILFGLYSVAKALEETTGPINVIYANGGFAQSPFWVQTLADVFNKKVHVCGNIQSSATGAVIVALKALGIIHRLEEASYFTPIQTSYNPQEELHPVYMKNFQVFERLYDKVKDEF